MMRPTHRSPASQSPVDRRPEARGQVAAKQVDSVSSWPSPAFDIQIEIAQLDRVGAEYARPRSTLRFGLPFKRAAPARKRSPPASTPHPHELTNVHVHVHVNVIPSVPST